MPALHDTKPEVTHTSPQQAEALQPEPDTSETVQPASQESSTVEALTTAHSKHAKKRFRLKPWHVIVASLLLLLGVIGAVGMFTFSVAQTLKAQAAEGVVLGRNAADAFKAQNLPAAQEQLKLVAAHLEKMTSTYEQLSFYTYLPVANSYYQDGLHGIAAARAGISAGTKTLDQLVPYADVLGFQGEGTFAGGTAEDRVRILLETLEKVMPSYDSIVADLEIAQTELAQIDPQSYPESIQTQIVRSHIIQAQTSLTDVVTVAKEFRPVIERLPSIAGGQNERKKYLILFQNNNELRPTGGFLTAYAVIYLENGKVTPEKSDDIYELDQKFTKKLPIPEKLGKYLITEKTWHLRDMNISPDFKTSMDTFFTNYKTVKGEPDNIDGIIAVDTFVLTRLLQTLGPVEIPGYGTFTAENDPRCDCPQVVYALSEIITRPTPYLREDRKGILGPLMSSILTKAYSANKTQWPALFDLGWKSVEQRHVQLYFMDETDQLAAEAINAAGRMQQPENSDFLGIINVNLAGAKSNLFITYDVKSITEVPKDGKVLRTVEVQYKNNRKGDNCNLEAGLLCLNSRLNDWTRIYVPAGSTLVEAKGFANAVTQYDEAGFTVFDGYFQLDPLGVATLRLTYDVPFTNSDKYSLYVWKQGGIASFPMLIEVNGNQEEKLVEADLEYSASWE